MRAFDGIDNTLANILDAKNHADEVIGSHRCLAALARHLKKTNAGKTGRFGAPAENRRSYPSFSWARGEVKRTRYRPGWPGYLARFSPQPPVRHPNRQAGSRQLAKKPGK